MDYVLLDKKQILEKYPFKRGGLNRLLSNRDVNGLNRVVRKIGGRIFFREDLLIEWIEEHKEV